MIKLIVISDTHGQHRHLKNVPNGDILIHAGDISNVGERSQVEDFIEWFRNQPHKHKIFIAGNHDRSLDPKFNKEINPYWDVETTSIFNSNNRRPYWVQDLLKSLEGTNVHYLENSEVIIDGIKFLGSPWTPWFFGEYWAFNKHRGDEIRVVWKNIPLDTNVLITHGPPAHKLDWCENGNLVGCHDLTYYIQMIKPKYHFFGHIHESYGVEQTIDTTYANASVLNVAYRISNKPLELEI